MSPSRNAPVEQYACGGSKLAGRIENASRLRIELGVVWWTAVLLFWPVVAEMLLSIFACVEVQEHRLWVVDMG